MEKVALSFFFALWAVSLWGLVWHFAADRIMEGGFDRIVENVDLVKKTFESDCLHILTYIHLLSGG